MTLEAAKQLHTTDEVYYAGAFYPFVELKEFPHGPMLGIFDEFPTNNHIDYINIDSAFVVYPCNCCQGGGCPNCQGYGKIISTTS